MTDHRLLLPSLAVLCVAGVALAHDGDPKILDKQPAYQGPGWINARKLAPTPAGGGSQGLQAAINYGHGNVSLLAWMPLSAFGVASGGNGNSCFGYTSPSGREYALFGHSNGTAFVEVTQPGNPVIVANLTGPNSLWRDVRCYGAYAYAVSEGGGGIQVFDLSQIDSGVVTSLPAVTTGGSTATHTLAVNTQSGRLYRAGGSTNGLRIYDLTANPASPAYLGAWSARYVHEAQIVTYPTGGPGGGPREIAICCGGLNTGYTDTGVDIVDVTNAAAPVQLGHFTYGSPGYSHQAWLSPDRAYLFQNDETDGLPRTRVFDATNINAASPTLPFLGYFVNGSTVDHNLYTKGSLIYEADYRSGLRVFDTSSGVLAPTLVGWFDTYPANDDTGYNGLWNNYPYFASGTVIGSDIERGLFVWWVGTPPIQFSFPGGQPIATDPAGELVTVQVTQAAPGTAVPGTLKLYWSTGGAYTAGDLTPIGGDLYRAAFPALTCGTSVSYYLAGTATNGVVWTSPDEAPAAVHQLTVASTSTVLLAADFEAGAQGFARDTAGDTATAGLWTRVDPVGTTAQPENNHTPGGTQCWVTGQGVAGGAQGAADVDGGRTSLLSPVLDLSAAAYPVVSYWRWYVNNGTASVDDTFRVEVSSNNGASWLPVETIGPGSNQATGGWYYHEFRVGDFVSLTSQVRVRFVAEDAGNDSTVEAAIDDFRVFDIGCNGGARAFCAGDGTNTPCPCGNTGAAGAGCANSTGQSGLLAASGTPQVSADTLSLGVSGLPATVSVLFFQGTQAQSSGLGSAFGDGLRCVSGSVVRLGTKTTSAGASSYPQAGDPSVSVRGGAAAGNTRYYQAWYRNADPAFCASETFNLTNGVSVVWGG
jgi:choice-of-anchor B domain-containing protein